MAAETPFSYKTESGEYLHKFPPFPILPEGTKIIPFKDFKEHGIRLESKDGTVEVDSLGIPTVELRHKHDTDRPKSDVKRVSMFQYLSGTTPSSSASASGGKEWYHMWAQSERNQGQLAFDTNYTQIDRIYQATALFQRRRGLPRDTPTHVQNLWDQYKLYVGLLSNTPIWHKKDQNKKDDDDDADDFSDVEADNVEGTKINVSTSAQHQYKKPPKPRPPYSTFGKDPIKVSNDDEIRELLEDESFRKEEKLMAFLDDIEGSTRIFLSSYMRKQGLIWSEKNLFIIPHILSLFFNFLIRHRVLPEHDTSRGLLNALKIVDLASKELPLTSKLAKAMPDDFSMACNECWGPKSEGYQIYDDEPDAKRRKTDADDEEAKAAKEAFEVQLKVDNVQLLTPDDVVMEEGDTPAENIGGWGNSEDNTWGTDNSDAWGGSADVQAWELPEPHFLMSLLGPTTFPMTHAPGIVEWSCRRIKEVVQPRSTALPKASGDVGQPNAEDIENELDKRFAKLILSPWIGWEDPEDEQGQSVPRILKTSKDVAQEGHKYDPQTDDITVLVLPSVLESLSLGMGIGGTWVQLARLQEDFGSGDGEKKKKKKSKTGNRRFWYMDQLVMTLTSFHTSQLKTSATHPDGFHV